ncbi:MAG: hypothetical protein OXG82_06085 [Gammaproteobacteria bacterium]|nr:hypothetical protein [Gammaproteobacteria bacterium]
MGIAERGGAGEIGEILGRAKEVAVDYYRATGKPLGVTGEVGEYEVARLLDLELSEARTAGYDATDAEGRRYQIKARSIPAAARGRSQRVGTINLAHAFDAVLLVVMDEAFRTLEIWEANREAVKAALEAPGSKARNERGALSVSQFRRIGQRVYG